MMSHRHSRAQDVVTIRHKEVCIIIIIKMVFCVFYVCMRVKILCMYNVRRMQLCYVYIICACTNILACIQCIGCEPACVYICPQTEIA